MNSPFPLSILGGGDNVWGLGRWHLVINHKEQYLMTCYEEMELITQCVIVWPWSEILKARKRARDFLRTNISKCHFDSEKVLYIKNLFCILSILNAHLNSPHFLILISKFSLKFSLGSVINWNQCAVCILNYINNIEDASINFLNPCQVMENKLASHFQDEILS